MNKLPTVEDIRAAAARLKPVARLTPLLEAPLLNEALGARILIKPEVLQRTGSFKFRGAYNTVAQLDEAARKRGVVAFSSGNHAQGVAHAATLLGAPATIVMPKDAPAIKIANTKAYGATVVTYDRHTENREAIGQRISEERGLTLIRPYDDAGVIAGQGTVGLELIEQALAMDARPDLVLCPAGGGGLIAGVSTAVQDAVPGLALYACEPEGLDDTARSLAAGKRLGNDPAARSYCDALLAPMPGEITFEINRKTLSGGLVVTDHEVALAMAAAFKFLKIVVEPGGAVALAAALTGKIDIKGKTVAIVLSGGNVDPQTYRAVLAEAGAA
jgi:threonine dehydratase